MEDIEKELEAKSIERDVVEIKEVEQLNLNPRRNPSTSSTRKTSRKKNLKR
jgi:hypothetical protein